MKIYRFSTLPSKKWFGLLRFSVSQWHDVLRMEYLKASPYVCWIIVAHAICSELGIKGICQHPTAHGFSSIHCCDIEGVCGISIFMHPSMIEGVWCVCLWLSIVVADGTSMYRFDPIDIKVTSNFTKGTYILIIHNLYVPEGQNRWHRYQKVG